MSLIHWWPLNGDLRDVIGGNDLAFPVIDNVDYNKGNITSNTNGKIGSCYARNVSNTNVDALRSKNKIKALTTQSICAWVYFIEANSGDYSTANGLVTNHNHSTNSGLGIGVFTTNGTDCRISVNAGTGSSRIHSDANYRGRTNIKDAWHHICLTYDTDKKIRMYVDGKEDMTAREYNLSSPSDYFDIFNWSIGHIGNSRYRPKCRLNDVRVYDHALSLSEVTELSKALVLHYTFDDELLKSTVNEAPNSGWSTYGSYWTLVERTGHGLKLQRPSTSTSTIVAVQNGTLKEKMAKDDVWTFSCYLYKDGQPYKSSCSEISSPTSYYYKTQSWESRDNGYYRNTFKITGTPGTWMLHNTFFGSAEIGPIYEMRYMKFEKGDYATPYSASWPAQTIANEAGFSGSTNQNDLMLSVNSAQGKYSGYFNGKTSYVDIPIIKSDMFTSDYTVSFWVYPLDNGRAIYLGDYNDSTGLNFERNSGDAGIFRYYHNGNPNWYYDAAGAPVGQWTHLVITYSAPSSSSTTGELLIYKNGICVNNNDGNTQKGHTSTTTKTIGGKTRLGADYRSTSTTDSTPLQGYMDDFRYYATCLKKEDIEDLYRTKAYITDKSDIVCNKFTEDCETALVTETSMFETMEIYENLLPEEYEQLEYIEFDYAQGSSEPYINTGYNTTGIYQIDCDIQVKAAANNYQFGQQQKSGWMYNGFYSTSSLEFNWAALTPRPAASARHIMTQTLTEDGSQIVITIDGVTWTTSPGTNGQGGDFYIFACRNSNNAFRHYGAGMRLYSFRIHEGHRTVREFIPAKRKSDSAIGLYDAATRGLYVNAGTGSFIGGPVVKNDEAMIYENGNIYGKEIIEI